METGKPDFASGNDASRGEPEAAAPPGDAGQVLSRRERGKRQCRLDILAAASELFAQLGYEKTGVKQIAEKVGVSVGALYSHFSGKEEMLHELLIQSIQEQESKGDAACAADDPPLVQLRSRMAAAAAHFTEHIDFMMIYHNESPHSLEGMVRAEIVRNIDLVAGLLDRAMARGDIARIDPNALAALIVGGFHELMRNFAGRGERNRLVEVPGIIDATILRPLELRARGGLETEGS